MALLVLLAISAAFDIVGLEREAFANTYYAAAVKSMLTSWSAFFFASFDSGSFVTVDKPPVGLWVQALSAKLFGFNGLSLLLPQAIAGVLSVAVLYWLVRRAYGPAAGLMAALALAVTPIVVVTNRNNTMDAQLVLVLLMAAWAVTLAAERGRLRLLLLGAVLMGLAYNIKMLQAYLVLPALWCMYLCWAPLRLRTRVTHLTAATVVLLAVSLSWSAVVDLTAAPGFAPGIGTPGPLRLSSDGLAGQASWLLPLAVLGLILAGWQLLPRPLGPARLALSSGDRDLARRRRVALTLWGLWLAGCGGYFSVARFYHVYYLIVLGPGVAALAGIGVAGGAGVAR